MINRSSSCFHQDDRAQIEKENMTMGALVCSVNVLIIDRDINIFITPVSLVKTENKNRLTPQIIIRAKLR
jgi:hypothetical protein